MSYRAIERPTKSQLEFCEVLGITVNGNDTLEDVSKKIDRAKGMVATRLVRETTIKPGCVVRKNYFDSEPYLCVLTKIGINMVCVRRLDNRRSEIFITVQYRNNTAPSLTIVQVFPPPPGWQHELAVTLEGGRISARKYPSRLRERFVRFLQKQLAPGERQTLEHGEYWLLDAVDRLRKRFVEVNGL